MLKLRFNRTKNEGMDMKAIITLVGFGLLALAVQGEAQVTSAANNLRAEIGIELTVAASDEADFSEVAPGVVYIVSPGGVKVPGGPGAGGSFEEVQPVTWTIDGQGSARLAITFMLTDRMINDAGGIIQVNYGTQSAGWNTSDDVTGSLSLFDPRSGTTVYLNDDGHAFVSLGAILAVSPAAPTGAYVGSVGLSAAYTGF